MSRWVVTCYSTSVSYTGRFEDTDQVELLYQGKALPESEREVSDRFKVYTTGDVLKYENEAEVRDNGNGICEVFWNEVERDALTSDEEQYQAKCEAEDAAYDQWREEHG